MMISAFGVEHVSKAAPKNGEYRIGIVPTTKKERRNDRIVNGVAGSALGGMSGAAIGLEHSGRAGLKGAAIGAGLGATLAAVPPPKAKATLVPVKSKNKDVSKRRVDDDRGGKVFGSPAKTAAVLGGAGVAFVGRNRANSLGGKIGRRVVARGDWSGLRATQMKNATLAGVRHKYARGVKAVGQEIGRSKDTREITGRLAAGATTGGIGGGVVYGRKRLTAVDDRKDR